MNRKVLATMVVITAQVLTSTSYAQFAGNAGIGLYGGAQACPYNSSVASGASSIQDDMDENIQDQIELKGDIADWKRDRKEIRDDISKAKSAISAVVKEGFSDMVLDHITNGYDCCQRPAPQMLSLMNDSMLDSSSPAYLAQEGSADLVARYPSSVDDDVWMHILSYDPDMQAARTALMTPMRDPNPKLDWAALEAKSRAVASADSREPVSGVGARYPAKGDERAQEEARQKRADEMQRKYAEEQRRQDEGRQRNDETAGSDYTPPPLPAPVPPGGGLTDLNGDGAKVCKPGTTGCAAAGGPSPAPSAAPSFCSAESNKGRVECLGSPTDSSANPGASVGAGLKCHDGDDGLGYFSPGWKAVCVGRGRVSTMVCTSKAWQKGEVSESKVKECKTAIEKLPTYQTKSNDIDTKMADAEAKLSDLKSAYNELKRDLKTQIREDARLEASCPECTSRGRGGRGRTKTNWASVGVGGVLSALGAYAGYSASKDSNLYNAKLGYPTYSNFPAIAAGASIGFPFIAGGLYGGTGSGVNGGFGCAPGGIGGGGFPYGPGGMYGPYGNGANPYGMGGLPFGSPFQNPLMAGGAFNPGMGIGGIPGIGGGLGGGLSLYSPFAGMQIPGMGGALGLQMAGLQMPGMQIGMQIPGIGGALGFQMSGLQIPGMQTGLQMSGLQIPGLGLDGSGLGMGMQMQQYQFMIEQQRKQADMLSSKLRVQQGLMQEYYSLLSRFQQLNSSTSGLVLGVGGLNLGGTFGSGGYGFGGGSGIGIGIGIGGVGSFGTSTLPVGTGRFNTAPRGTR